MGSRLPFAQDWVAHEMFHSWNGDTIARAVWRQNMVYQPETWFAEGVTVYYTARTYPGDATFYQEMMEDATDSYREASASPAGPFFFGAGRGDTALDREWRPALYRRRRTALSKGGAGGFPAGPRAAPLWQHNGQFYAVPLRQFRTGRPALYQPGPSRGGNYRGRPGHGGISSSASSGATNPLPLDEPLEFLP